MYSKKIRSFLLITLCIFLAVSCKKKKGINLSTIKIATVDFTQTGGVAYHYRITSDTYNTVDSIVSTGGGVDTGNNAISKFTYIGSSFRITDAQGLSYFVDANTSGMILEVQKYDTILMIYNGSQLAELDYKTPISTPPYYTIDATTYQWNNGDITTYGLPHGVVDSYLYNYGRSGQEGDAGRINDFLMYGRSYKNTAHLPVQLKYANGKENYFYTFDSNGRISIFTKVISGSGAPNDTSAYIYSYY